MSSKEMGKFVRGDGAVFGQKILEDDVFTFFGLLIESAGAGVETVFGEFFFGVKGDNYEVGRIGKGEGTRLLEESGQVFEREQETGCRLRVVGSVKFDFSVGDLIPRLGGGRSVAIVGREGKRKQEGCAGKEKNLAAEI